MMSYFRKFTAAISALAVMSTSVFTFSVAVAATTFTDASAISDWALNSITSLADDGVLAGRPDGSFDPKGNLNRAEMAKVAMLAAGLTQDTTGAPHFNDVAPADWYYSFVETLYNNGVVGGINGGALDSNGLATYNPSGVLNRAEGSKILVDAFELETAYAGTPPNFPDVASSAWYYDYVETAYAHGILNGYDNGNFGPADPITREQVAVIAQASRIEAADGSKRRATYTAGAASSVTPEDDNGTTVPTSDGTLTVVKSPSSPVAQTFPVGAASTPVAAYNFTATGDAIVVQNVIIKRTGVGLDTGWTLYLYDGDNRLTSGKTINSTSHEATFNGVNVTVPAGTTKTLTLRADTAATAAGESYFSIEAAAKITTNAKSVAGSFPVVSNLQKVDTSVTAGSITIAKNGSISNPKVGEDNATIAKFKLTTSGEAASVKQIALLVDGTISPTDVQNAKLYQGTTLLASTTGTNSKDLLVFTLATPFEIIKGDSRNFEVKADFNTGRGGDTVHIYLDENTDLSAIGGTYGFGMSVTSGDYDGVTGGGTDDSESTLQGGDVTLSSSGPTAADIAVNAKDVHLLDFNITSVSEITVKKLGISLTTNDAGSTAGGLLDGTTSNYTDIKVINKTTGAVVLGPIDANVLNTASGGTTAIAAATDDDGFYTFQDEFTMAAGESLDLAITADLANNTGAAFIDDTVYASIDISAGTVEIKDVNNKTIDNAVSVVPTSDINGKTMTVKSASLTVTKSSTPVSDTAVKGTQDVSLIGLTMAAGAASEAKITELVVRVRADDDTAFLADQLAASDFVNNIELWIGGTKVAGPEGLTLVGTAATGYYKATFDNMSYTIPAGSTVQVVVKGDLSTNVSATTYIGADIIPSTDITAEDKDGNTVAATGSDAINGAATQNPLITVSTGGSLTIAVDADTAKENIVVAGTSDVAISKFKFTSTDEAFKVQKLSINNRQSAVAAANLGDYDNNVVAIKLSYTNSSGATETKLGYLTNGTADFSGLDIAVPADDDAILTVTSTLNTISAGATAGEFVDLNLAFNDFEAVAQGSGETYKSSKLDEGVSASSDLDFGTVTYTDTTLALAGAAQTVVLGSAATITTPDLNVSLPVGTIVKLGGDTAAKATTDILLVLTTKYTDGDLSLIGVIADDGDTAAASADVWYALPGTGYLSAANQMVVYESKPTIALASSSPSGSRTMAAADGIFVFTISADAAEKVQLRAAAELATCIAGTGSTITSAVSATAVDGSGCDATAVQTGGDDIAWAAGTNDLSAYAYASFWIRWNDDSATATFDATGLGLGTADANDGTLDQETALAAANFAVGSATLTEGTWYFVKDVAIPAGTNSSDTHLLIEVNTPGNLDDAADDVFIDRVLVYNEKLNVNFASDASMAAAGNALVAYLKEGGSTVATGYISETSTSAASVTFIPTTAIEISKGTSKTFTVETATTTLITDQAGTDDLLTPSIALGSSTNGTVTAGDFWWNETNATVKWLGQVASSTLNGNTLKY